jgi:hypothetical protein
LASIIAYLRMWEKPVPDQKRLLAAGVTGF